MYLPYGFLVLIVYWQFFCLDGATGTIADWVKHRFNPPLVATYQLRDTGSFGYTLPVVQVQPSCEETFDSVMALIREAKHVGVLWAKWNKWKVNFLYTFLFCIMLAPKIINDVDMYILKSCNGTLFSD